MKQKREEAAWEFEECHFAVGAVHSSVSSLLAHSMDSTAASSHTRKYKMISSVSTLYFFSPHQTKLNDPALKSQSHLVKLSIAHALAHSTLLAHYETNAQRVLSSPLTLFIPKQLATPARYSLNDGMRSSLPAAFSIPGDTSI
jgi:hypothetical protein